ncbi:glycosyltransferase family 2 protein [Candidatus Nomurabacteria bacterium]|nr:glycosyltransferase family 2 protein [Candidatus Nomurabacteria bacterium]
MKISLVIPTYNEKANIKELLIKIKEEFDKYKIDGEIIVVDDKSPDGTGDTVENLKTQFSNLKAVHRSGKLGLSSAVIEGFNVSEGDIFCVMDADLSHPVEKIYEMYKTIEDGADFVVGSRYIEGGDIKGWNLYRKILSKGATILARVFTEVRDPMSGFFMFKKDLLMNKEINPKGFKILLELLIKLDCKNIVEIPIVFTNRTVGKSKAGTREIIYYLQNLLKYLPYKKRVIYEFIKFSCVGLIGTFVNISVLYLFTDLYNIYYILSAIIAFIVAVTINYILNKLWTFNEKLSYYLVSKYFNFFAVSLMALSVNLIFLYVFTEYFKIYYIFSQVIAIGLSLIINFIGNKIWTFRK